MRRARWSGHFRDKKRLRYVAVFIRSWVRWGGRLCGEFFLFISLLDGCFHWGIFVLLVVDEREKHSKLTVNLMREW